MLGLIRLTLRFVWLTLFILGVRRAIEIVQGGADAFIDRIEEGEAEGIGRILVRLHEVLHRVHAHASDDGDALGEM